MASTTVTEAAYAHPRMDTEVYVAHGGRPNGVGGKKGLSIERKCLYCAYGTTEACFFVSPA